MKQINECGFMIKQIHDTIGKKANAELEKNGLTLSQIRFIQYVFEKGGTAVPLKEIETFFNVAQPTIAGITRRLEAKKFIKTSPDKKDRRAKNVSLTAKGVQQAESCSKSRTEMDSLMLKSLTKNERALFIEYLNKICSSFVDSTK